jgi:nitrite reductase (NADH) small subunit
LWRGIVGSIGGRPAISSPMFKQRFLLETGECLDDPTRSIEVVMIREHDGSIEVVRA